MDNVTLFKQAHQMAREAKKDGDCYKVVFGQCLKAIKAEGSTLTLSLHSNYATFKGVTYEVIGYTEESIGGFIEHLSDDSIYKVIKPLARHVGVITTGLCFITTMLIGAIYLMTLAQ